MAVQPSAAAVTSFLSSQAEILPTPLTKAPDGVPLPSHTPSAFMNLAAPGRHVSGTFTFCVQLVPLSELS